MRRLPSEFLERLKKIYPASTYQKIYTTFNQRRPTTFRINTLKAKDSKVVKELTSQGFKIKPAPLPNFFIVASGSLREIQKTRVYLEGLIYVQGLSSALPAMILNPREGEFVLDLCAAPGSKTSQMASSMENKGRIVSIEKVKPRFYKLLNNIKIQGVKNVEPILFDGTIIFKKYSEEFDKVLVDAPCSAEGRFYVGKPRTFLYWKPRKIREMARKQKRLVLAGLRVLKKGGVLVYSTCTFSPEENEAIIDYVLKRYEGKIAIEDININISNVMPGLRRWQNREFHPLIKNTLRIIPTNLFEGFYIARLRKKESFCH